MNAIEQVSTSIRSREQLAVAVHLAVEAGEHVYGHAHGLFTSMSPKDWKKNPRTGLMEPDYRWRDTPVGPMIDPDSAVVALEDESWNLITNVGRVLIHTQIYATTGILTNGLNWMALSNDALTETSTSTTLSNEITTNGLARAQGTVTLPTGSGTQTTIAKTFTATGTQAAQKCALFTASSVGTMNHALAFTQRTLNNGDAISVTITSTVS